eukprot:SAG11_NODE_1617_length_4575_cov_7.041332_1_plen_50_part_00
MYGKSMLLIKIGPVSQYKLKKTKKRGPYKKNMKNAQYGGDEYLRDRLAK